MAFSSPSFHMDEATRKKQRVALISRIRQNFALKLISLGTAIFLYFFVQSERNPTVNRPMVASLINLNAPDNVEVEADLTQLEVTITGPGHLLDGLKPGDLRLIADLSQITSDKAGTQRLRPRFDIVGLTPDTWQQALTFQPTQPPLVKYNIYPIQTRRLEPQALLPRPSLVGFHYGKPQMRPAVVKVTGRSDRVARVTGVFVAVDSGESGRGLEGDFPVLAKDRDNNTVEGVTIVPDTIHVKVPLEAEQPSKTVTISPTLTDQPAPPYLLSEITVTPRQVTITGSPEQINSIFTLGTEDISIRDLTGSRTFDVNLIKPKEVTVHDPSGRLVTTVTVRVTVRRLPTPPAEQPNPPNSGAAPRTSGTP